MTTTEIVNRIEKLPYLNCRKSVRREVQEIVDGLREYEFVLCCDLLQKEREEAEDG